MQAGRAGRLARQRAHGGATRAERDRLTPVPLCTEHRKYNLIPRTHQTFASPAASCSGERHRSLNRARINDSLLTAPENENVTAPRASIGALSSAEFLPQRVSLLYRLSGNDVPAILLTSVIAAFALWGYISDRLLVAWLIWLVVASLVRIVLKRAYRLRRPGPEAAVGALEYDAHQASHHQPNQPGDEESVADIAPKGKCRNDRGEKDGGDVVSRQPVKERDSLRQEFSRGEGTDRGARSRHVFVLASREERFVNFGTV